DLRTRGVRRTQSAEHALEIALDVEADRCRPRRAGDAAVVVGVHRLPVAARDACPRAGALEGLLGDLPAPVAVARAQVAGDRAVGVDGRIAGALDVGAAARGVGRLHAGELLARQRL